MKVHFILYVQDQNKSMEFYSKVLNQAPHLHVPGMTEFIVNNQSVLGLMPLPGIKKLLGEKLPRSSLSDMGIPRAELYLVVDNAHVYHQRALQNGALELSQLQERDWGDRVAYSLDSDGYVLAFAERLDQ